MSTVPDLLPPTLPRPNEPATAAAPTSTPPSAIPSATSPARWHADPRRRSRGRAWRMLGGVTLLMLVTGTFIWIAMWFQPPQPVAVLLVGAGYHQNLVLPQNVHGWNSLHDLSQVVSGNDAPSYWGNRLWRGTPHVQKLQGNFDWATALKPQASPSHMVFISAHGASDREGAYLLTDDATTANEPINRVRITALLDQLALLPAEKHKILVLDACYFNFQPQLGMLQNDFVTDLKDLDDQIRGIPNLVVISAADVNQRSWTLPSWGRTVFAHFWIEGIHGAAHDANSDGRITLVELYDFAAGQTSEWVTRHITSVQTPILLPSGDEGRKRGERVTVGWRNQEYAATTPNMTTPTTVPKDLYNAWKVSCDLARRDTPPYFHQPQLWRLYQATLKRYEELVLAGDREYAPRLYEQQQRLANRCLHDPSMQCESLDVLRASSDPAIESTADTILDELAATPIAQRGDCWRKHQAQLGERLMLVRAAIFRRLIEQAITDPITQLANVCALTDTVRDPLLPLPPELHFALMLNHDLPAEMRGIDDLPLLSQALRVRQLAEHATTGNMHGFTLSSPLGRVWVAKAVAEADTLRRQGEDLLFTTANQRGKAAECFQKAQVLYLQAFQHDRVVQEAFHTRDAAFSLLPDICDLIAMATTDGGQHPLISPEECAAIQDLWRHTHGLSRQLSRPEPQFLLIRPSTVDMYDPSSASLQERSQQVAKGLEVIRERITQRWRALAAQDHISNQLGLVNYPATPTLELDVRNAGVQQQLTLTQRRHEDMAQLLSIVAGDHFRSPTVTRPLNFMEQQREMQTLARVRGHLALAVLGQGIYDELGDKSDDTWAQSQFRLDMLPVESAWRESLLELGEQIALRWTRLPMEVSTILDASNAEGTQHSNGRSEHADAWSRLMPIAFAAQLDDGASRHMLHLRLGEYLLWQSQRTWQDHWYSETNDQTPYYQTAGQGLLADAKRIAPKLEYLEEVEKSYSEPDDWGIEARAQGALTSEQPLTLSFTLSPGTVVFQPQGYVALHWTVQEPLLVGPNSPVSPLFAAWPAERRPLAMPATVEVDTSVLATNAAEHATPSISLGVYFRGRRLQRAVPIEVYLRPEILARNALRPATAHLVTVASQDLQHRYGEGQGAISIVIDCSGSMGSKPGQPFTPQTRYAQATAALDKVVRGIPPGTQVSLWLFGQAQGPQKTAAEAEQTIRCIRKLSPWQPHDADALLKQVTHPTVEPWNESAVVSAILAAKDELTQAKGFKTMVVLTDGIDNRFEHNKQANPQHKDVATALSEAFRNTGIVLSVVGFQIASHEDQMAHDQFSVIESFNPPGRFYKVDESAELVAALAAAFDQRLRYWVQDYDRRLVEGVPAAGLPINPLGQAMDSPLVTLPPGEYLARLWARSSQGKPIVATGGDLLAANVVEQDGTLSMMRLPILQHFFADQPTRSANAWRVALLNPQRGAPQLPGVRVAIELQPDPREVELAVPSPRELWWEFTQSDGTPVSSFTSDRIYDRAPTQWQLHLPPPTQQRDLTLTGWWLAENTVPATITLTAGRDFTTLAELAGRTFEIAGETLTIEDVRIQQRSVLASDGTESTQPCLLATLQSPAQQTYLLRLQDGVTRGHEHRCYPSIGRYIGVYWPCDEHSLIANACRLEIVSLATLKNMAAQQGTHVVFDPNDVRTVNQSGRTSP